VLHMVDKRKRVPSLPSLVQLENEVNRFDDAEQFLSNKTNIDLLLGTQGWRRYSNSINFSYICRFIYLSPTSLSGKDKTLADKLFAVPPKETSFTYTTGSAMPMYKAHRANVRAAAREFHPDKNAMNEAVLLFDMAEMGVAMDSASLETAEEGSAPPCDSELHEEFQEIVKMISGNILS
jgi:hypothetical protein